MERSAKGSKEAAKATSVPRRHERHESIHTMDRTARSTERQADGRRSSYWKSLKVPGRLLRRGTLPITSKGGGIDKMRKGSTRSNAGPIVITAQEIEKRSTFYDIMKDNLLLLAVLLSLVAGFTIGALLNQKKFTERQVSLLRFPGELFMRVLQCLVIPLVMTSVVSAVGGRPPVKSAWLALRTLAYFTVTTLTASLCGMLLTLLIKPGAVAKQLPYHPKPGAVVGIDSMLDILRNIFPDNFVEAFIYTTQSTAALVLNGTRQFDFDRPESGGAGASDDEPVKGRLMTPNLAGLVAFSLLVGLALSRAAPSPNRPGDSGDVATSAGNSAGEGCNMILRLCRVLSDKFLRMADLVLWYSPVGICFLVAADAMRSAAFSTVLWHLGQYAFTVFLGLGVHAFLVLPALYMTRVRRKAGKFFFNLLYPLAIAFGVSSSSAASPVTMATLEKRVGLDPATVRLVIPLGAILNRDGTALNNMVATLFCVQLQGANLGATSLLVLLIVCWLTSLGLHGIQARYGGTAHVSLLLAVVGLPSDNIGYIAVLHWLLDRACSSVNLMSDCVGVAVLQDPQPDPPVSPKSLGARQRGGPPTPCAPPSSPNIQAASKPYKNTR